MRIRKYFSKVLVLIIVICFAVNVVALANEQIVTTTKNSTSNEGNIIYERRYYVACLRAAEFLERLGIVDSFSEKWSETDYIKRRDLFDMIYRIIRHPKSEFNGTYEAYYADVCDEFTTPESLYQRILEYRQEEIESDYLLNYGALTKEFVDIDQNSQDFIYWYTWVTTCILHGKIDENGNYYADLDGYLTNYEALKTIINMFYICAYDAVSTMDGEYANDYFQFAEDIGLINHKSLLEDSYTSIDREDINEYITAYDCMNLVYYALYIPTFTIRYPLDPNYRLIKRYYTDGFTGNRPK